MKVELWHLGLPEDELWTAGDEKVWNLRVEATGEHVGGLDPGRYRLFCEAQREGAADPPEFRLESGENHVEARVEMPRTRTLHLRVHAEDGRLLESGTRTVSTGISFPHWGWVPPWASPRREKLPDGRLRGRSRCGGGEEVFSIGGPGPVEVQSGPEGLDGGIWTEPSRNGGPLWSVDFSFAGRNRVTCWSAGASWSTGRSVALAVPLERVTQGVRLPNGDPLPDQGVVVEARCESMAVEEGDPGAAWRSLPIHVAVQLPGYRSLDYDFRLDDPVVPRTLERNE